MDITKVIISVSVAIMIVIGVLVPILGNMTVTDTVYGENEMNPEGAAYTKGKYRYAETFTATVEGGMSIDGVSIYDIWAAGGGRFIVTNMGAISTSAQSAFVFYGDTVATNVTEISLSNGTMTYKVSGSDEESTVENIKWAYMPDGNGTFIQTTLSMQPYVNADAQVIQFNASTNTRGVGYGTVTDRVVDVYYVNNVSSHDSVTITFVPIQMGKSTVYGIATSTPPNIIVPEKYVYLGEVAPTGIEYDLLQVIPLLIILSLMIGVATYAIGRRT